MSDLSQSPVTAMVAEFMRTFGGSLDFRLWMKLIEEERQELIDAETLEEGDEAVLKELADLVYVSYGAALVCTDFITSILPVEEALHIQNLTKDCDALIGEIMEIHGWDDDLVTEAVSRVHASNMSKLGDDGQPIRREDGKIMKGPNYTPPDLTDLVEVA